MRELLKVLIRIAVAVETIATNTTPAEPEEPPEAEGETT